MTMQANFVPPGPPLLLDEDYPPEWWEQRSCDELRQIIGRGVHGGDMFIAATREMERRALAGARVADASAAGDAARQRRTLLMLVAAFLALCAVAAGIGLLTSV